MSLCTYFANIIGVTVLVLLAHLGDIRSLLPSNVNIMALTATATNETYKAVCDRLSLKHPILVGIPPNSPNITYKVQPLVDMNDFCAPIAREMERIILKESYLWDDIQIVQHYIAF